MRRASTTPRASPAHSARIGLGATALLESGSTDRRGGQGAPGERVPMARWSFEPGHTAAEFCVRHMMVTHVRGHFKNVHGSLEFDPSLPEASRVEATIDARGLWSGEPDRDAHLRSPDFLDVERFPEITFTSSAVRLMSPNEALVTGALTIRGAPAAGVNASPPKDSSCISPASCSAGMGPSARNHL